MQRHRSALPVMRDLDLQAEHVAQLPLKREKICVDGLGAVPRACTGNIGTRTWLDEAGALLGLADRKALGDHFLGQFLGVWSSSNRPRMTHTDIASY